MSVEFTDNSVKVKGDLSNAVIAYLYEAAGELEAQVKKNTRVDTGATRASWSYRVNESDCEAVVGSSMENAIWEEFGTGEYALHGDGRKGGWTYRDEKGKYHRTDGKKPNRALQSAFIFLKPVLIRKAEEMLKERFGN